MSGNSRCSRRQTAPIVRSFSLREGACVAVISRPIPLPWHVCHSRTACHEGHPVLADLDLVAVLELCALDAPTVDEGAVQRALVLDREAAVVLAQDGVPARDGDVVEEDPAVGRAADRGPLALRRERL